MVEDLLTRLDSLECRINSALEGVQTSKDLTQLKTEWLGKKGRVTEILKGLGDVDGALRSVVGAKANALKTKIVDQIALKEKFFATQKLSSLLADDTFDSSLPGLSLGVGHLHPLTQVMEELCQLFSALGFAIFEGPQIETDYYNFAALNIAPNHPARDMQDTFYLRDGRLLRTHTSPVQIHVMEKYPPPLQMIAPGVVYRRDSDMTHAPMFHQIEGLMVGEAISFADLKGVIELLVSGFFGPKTGVHFRPSFFPFTEPSAEVDIQCVLCAGEGCRVCQQSGWLEIMGCGMVQPKVFAAVGIDTERWQGFAFGLGVERVAMLKYGIGDLRLFFDNHPRFLEQF